MKTDDCICLSVTDILDKCAEQFDDIQECIKSLEVKYNIIVNEYCYLGNDIDNGYYETIRFGIIYTAIDEQVKNICSEFIRLYENEFLTFHQLRMLLRVLDDPKLMSLI